MSDFDTIRLFVGFRSSYQADMGFRGQKLNRPSDRASLNIFDQIDSICREYLLRAGEMALDAFAMETALNHFRNAEQCQPNGMEPELVYRLHSGLGKALAGCNTQPEAISHFDRAIAASNNKEAIASCLYAQGEVYWRNGDNEEGSRRMEAARRPKVAEVFAPASIGLPGGLEPPEAKLRS